MHSCVREKHLVHLLEGWWFRCIHVSGLISVHLPEEWWFRCIHVWGVFLCIHVWGVGFQCIFWGITILVHSCVMGKIPVHLLEGWWFWCIHELKVRFRCIYLRSIDFGVFMCEGQEFGAFTLGIMILVHSCVRDRISIWCSWGVTIVVHSCVRGKIPVHLLERWWFRCIQVWGVGFLCIYLRSDDFGAFMCEG